MAANYEYLVIGHVTRDLLEQGWRIGGTASYSGRAGQALGAKTAVVTSFDASFPVAKALPNVSVWHVPATETTTFSNIYTPRGREQTVHSIAAPLSPTDIPQELQDVPLVHLAPLVREVDPSLASSFPNSLVGITPQGWLRSWDREGRITASSWSQAEAVLQEVDAVVLSEEDMPNRELLYNFRAWATLMVVTQADQGCTVYWQGEERHFPAPAVEAVAVTGAGDIFAATFLLQLSRSGGDAWSAAQLANQVAALSVTASTLDEKMMLVADYAARKKEIDGALEP